MSIFAAANSSARSNVHSRLDGLCDRANLVNFEQQAVAGLVVHSLQNAPRVGDCQIISNHLCEDTTVTGHSHMFSSVRRGTDL